MAEERVMGAYTHATVEDNLADAERLRLPVERSMYPRVYPKVEHQPHTPPTTEFFRGASHVTMKRNQISISSVQNETRPTSKGDYDAQI